MVLVRSESGQVTGKGRKRKRKRKSSLCKKTKSYKKQKHTQKTFFNDQFVSWLIYHFSFCGEKNISASSMISCRPLIHNNEKLVLIWTGADLIGRRGKTINNMEIEKDWSRFFLYWSPWSHWVLSSCSTIQHWWNDGHLQKHMTTNTRVCVCLHVCVCTKHTLKTHARAHAHARTEREREV